MRRTIAERRLVWLPWYAGSPPLSAAARLQLGCALRHLQQRNLRALPRSRPRRDLGENVFVSRVRDPPVDRKIAYRIYSDAIVVVELVPDRPEYWEHTFHLVKRLRDYAQRAGDLAGSEWLAGQIGEFLQLTPEQSALVDIRVALAGRLRRLRVARRWTQTDLALKLGSSTSRVAKMEISDPSVSIDLLVRSLLALGVSRAQLGWVVAGGADLRATGHTTGRADRQTRAAQDEPATAPGASDLLAAIRAQLMSDLTKARYP
jgi:transcriptional regulator with XRE-family HTH domain